MSELLHVFSKWIENVVWGSLNSWWGLPAEWGFTQIPVIAILLVLCGVIFTLFFGFPQVRYFWHAIKITKGDYDDPNKAGEITHFQALCAALSATIGLGNIAGVAFAVAAGGPGAVFWMWVAGFLGMATKFTSISLSLMHRDESGSEVHGGPMYTIKKGLADNYREHTNAASVVIWGLVTGLLSFGMSYFLGGTIAFFVAALISAGIVFWMNKTSYAHETDKDDLLHWASKNVFLLLAALYAIFVTLSSFGAGNMFQSNQMAGIVNNYFGVETWITGLVFSALAFAVLVGGIKSIGKVAEKLVPAMVVIYFLGSMWIIFSNIGMIPDIFGRIITGAFTPAGVFGGFVGATFATVLKQGLQRGVFSNEAGMGSAAIAHTAAKSDPVQEGFVGLLGPFIDTLVVCTMTALVILITDAWATPAAGAGSDMTAYAFSTVFGPIGGKVLAIIVLMFAFSTIISWSYYGEQGIVYLFGYNKMGILVYRLAFVFITFLGTQINAEDVLRIVDAFFGMLAYPNLLANFLLLPVLAKAFKEYKKKYKI